MLTFILSWIEKTLNISCIDAVFRTSPDKMLLLLFEKLLPHTDAERKSLYTLFLESVQSRLRRGEESPTDMVTEQQATKRSLIKMQSIVARHLELEDIHDPLMAINFARLFA